MYWRGDDNLESGKATWQITANDELLNWPPQRLERHLNLDTESNWPTYFTVWTETDILRVLADRGITYSPLPSQQRFHESYSRFKGFSGPVGSGKSRALCYEALALCYVNEGRVGLIGAPTYPMLRDATLASFRDICDAARIPYSFNQALSTMTLHECGSTILFRSLDNPERLRGPNLAWFGVDEMTYVTEAAWVQLEARLRDPRALLLRGAGVWTPKGFNWVHRRFFSDAIKGYQMIRATAFENQHLLEQVPDYYERLKASYDSRFYEQEVLGQYLALQSGNVYFAFDRTHHTGSYSFDASEPIYWSWDFNINPMSSVVCQRRGEGFVVVDEIVLKSSSTGEVCDEFARRYGKHRGKIYIYGDSSGNKRNTVTGTSDFDMIRQIFGKKREWQIELHVTRANPLVRDRLNLVNNLLENTDGDHGLRVDSRCRELIADFERVTYKPDSGQIDKSSDPMRTHVSDALGYLIWQECRSRGRAGEQGGRLVF